MRRFAAAVAVLLAMLVPAAPVQAAPTPGPGPVPQLDYAHQPIGKTAPKGQPDSTAPSKTQPNTAETTLTTACSSPCFRYATANDTVTQEGSTITTTIQKPALLITDYHTLFEMSAQKTVGGLREVIEVGYNVDRTVNGDDNPHLFVYHWVHGAETCYNGCGFVPAVGATYTAGQSLATQIGTARKFEILHIGTAWWIRYDNTWLGAYPDSIWGTGVFPNGDLFQAFSEAAIANDPSQTDATNGQLSVSTTTGALANGFALYDEPTNTWPAGTLALGVVTDPTRWNATMVDATSFRVGGPGGNEHIYDCSGTGISPTWGGYGAVCPYTNTSGGVPVNKIVNLQKDGTVPRNTCFPNFGTADGQTTNPIRVWTNTTYVKWAWFRDANCAGANYTFDYGVQVMPAGWTALAHASLLRWSTPVTGH